MVKRRSCFQVAALLMVIASASALASISYAQAEALGSWTSTNAYPTYIALQSCATYSGYIYCVGGWDPTAAVYSASVSSGSVGSWTLSTNSYPASLAEQSCAIDSGYMYCVGGNLGSSLTDAVYSASVSGGSVGSWTLSTNPYPTNIYVESCAIYSGYMYCVGGFTVVGGSGETAAVYSASVSGGSVGSWTLSTNPYPTTIEGQPCAIDSGYVYCIGGWTGSVYTDAVYSASVLGGSVGSWTLSTNSYPASLAEQSCAIDSGYMYCVGGLVSSSLTDAVYSASVLGGSVGSWTLSTNPYPTTIDGQPCAIDSGYMYCVGGLTTINFLETQAVYSAPILVPTSSTTLSATSSSTTFTTSSASTTSSIQTPVSSTTTTSTRSASMTNTLLTTITTAGSKAGTSTTTFTSPLSTSYSTAASSSVVGSSTSYAQTGTTTTGATQSSTTSTETSFSTTSSGGTITITETDTYNVLLTQIVQELEQFEALILQTLGFQVTATPVGQQVNQVVVTVTSSTTVRQVTMTVGYSVVGGGTPTAPVFHYVLKGASKWLALTKTPEKVSVDLGSIWSVTPNPLVGSSSSERWHSSQKLTGTASSGTIVFTFQHQYYLTMKASEHGTVTPSSGWQNAGVTVTIKATASSGYKFKSWTGSGTGSYTGTSASHTITMNAAITETANFT